jgi:hypothetical protein
MTTTVPTTIDSKKPNTKQELIAANIKLLIEQLEAGHSDALTNYLTAMLSQLQLWECAGDRAADARCNPRCRVLDVEEPWPLRQCRSQRNGSSALRDAAMTYKVDTDLIGLKVKQEFAAKEKAKKSVKPEPKPAAKAKKAA